MANQPQQNQPQQNQPQQNQPQQNQPQQNQPQQNQPKQNLPAGTSGPGGTGPQANQPNQPNQPNQANQANQSNPLMAQAQTVGATYGFDWSKLWGIISKISPQLQQIFLILLEEANNVPALANAQPGTYQVNFADVQTVAQTHGMDASDLMAFLSQISPAIAQLMLSLLRRIGQ